MVWVVSGRPFLGDPSGPSKLRKRSHASWRSCFFFRRSAPVQRGAHFVIFDVPCDAPCWAQRAHQKRYEITDFLMIFHMKGTLGAATKCIPKSKNCKMSPENKCSVRLPWELFGVHLGWSIFWCVQLGCSSGAPKSFKNILKQMIWDVLGGYFWGAQPGPYGQQMRSRAARDSFFMFAKRSHAAWGSFF